MGMTGAGKSTFVNLITDPEDEVEVGHSLESCTTEVQLAAFDIGGSRTGYLVDTPGFDDTSLSDTEILKEIAGFLLKLYEVGIKISGLIYLHRINEPRMTGSALKNLEVFRRLCGDTCFPQVALVSTMWQELPRPEGEKLGIETEAQLLSNNKFWGAMTKAGSQHFRHSGDTRSARRIIEWFLSHPARIVLEIQRELVDDRLNLDQTEAGRYLQHEAARLKERYEKELRGLQTEIADAYHGPSKEPDDDVHAQIDRVEVALSEIDQNTRDMSINARQLESEKSLEYAERATAVEREYTGSTSELDLASLHAELRQAKEQIYDLENDMKQRDKEISQQIAAYRRQDNAKAREAIRQLETRLVREREASRAKQRLDRKRQDSLERALQRGSAKVSRIWRALSEFGGLVLDPRPMFVEEDQMVMPPRRVLTGDSNRSIR
jgi:50S ribosome-binding GTPase